MTPPSVPIQFSPTVTEPARRHTNPDGSEGGWVSISAQVDSSAWVHPTATVYGLATIHNEATVGDTAQVFGEAMVLDRARILENARVSGTTHVSDRCVVAGNARVEGNAIIREEAAIEGCALVTGNAMVMGMASIAGHVQVSGQANVGGEVMLHGYQRIADHAELLSDYDVVVVAGIGIGNYPVTLYRCVSNPWEVLRIDPLDGEPVVGGLAKIEWMMHEEPERFPPDAIPDLTKLMPFFKERADQWAVNRA